LVKVQNKVYIVASYAGGILLFDDTGKKVSSDTIYNIGNKPPQVNYFCSKTHKKFVLNERGEVIVDTTQPGVNFFCFADGFGC
jgi:hypothetical protein